MNQQEMYLL